MRACGEGEGGITHSSWNLREPYGEGLPTSLRVRAKLAVLPLHDKVGWEGPGLSCLPYCCSIGHSAPEASAWCFPGSSIALVVINLPWQLQMGLRKVPVPAGRF